MSFHAHKRAMSRCIPLFWASMRSKGLSMQGCGILKGRGSNGKGYLRHAEEI